MTDLETLVATALIGTERQALPPLALVPDLSAENREAALLAAAALVSNYRTAGYVAGSNSGGLEPSGADSKPELAPAMRNLLHQILAAHQGLLPEYLDLLIERGLRLAHRDLPQLLELGRSNNEYRSRILNLLDTRGRWLAGHNKPWAWATGSTESEADARQSFELGAKSARALAFRALRERDPEGARALLETAWKQEAANERKEFIALLEVDLSPADEPFLEAALTDRSGDVRSTAADLLVKLPDSAFNTRTEARLRPILKVVKPKAKNALEKVKDGVHAVLGQNTGKLEIELPESFDPAWARDGIEEKAPQSVGQKQWWVRQMMARATLPMLEKITGMDAVTLLKNTHKDWKSFVQSAVSNALKQSPERELVKRLIAYDITVVRDSSLEAFKVLEPSFLETLAAQRSFLDANSDLTLLNACQHTWSEGFWTQAVEWIAHQATRLQTGAFSNYFYGFSDTITNATALSLIPRLLEGHPSLPQWTALLARYAEPADEKQKNRWYWEYTQREIRELLGTLRLRLEMHEVMK